MAHVSSRRALRRGSAAGLLAGTAAASAEPGPDADAELVRVCHAFAEAEYRNWWRYITAPDHLADAQDREPDWSTLAWIEATAATTPAGWQAKALAYAAWWREAYDDAEGERDASTSLLAALLRDMVAPVRAAILARCAADYGRCRRATRRMPGGSVGLSPPSSHRSHPSRWLTPSCTAPVPTSPVPRRKSPAWSGPPARRTPCSTPPSTPCTWPWSG